MLSWITIYKISCVLPSLNLIEMTQTWQQFALWHWHVKAIQHCFQNLPSYCVSWLFSTNWGKWLETSIFLWHLFSVIYLQVIFYGTFAQAFIVRYLSTTFEYERTRSFWQIPLLSQSHRDHSHKSDTHTFSNFQCQVKYFFPYNTCRKKHFI